MKSRKNLSEFDFVVSILFEITCKKIRRNLSELPFNKHLFRDF